MSGWAMTNPPSGVIMTPPIGPSDGTGPSTVLRKLRGIPVVRLNRGLLSNSLSSLVGQSWIQWPEGRGSRGRASGRQRACAQRKEDKERRTSLAASVADVPRRKRLVGKLGDEVARVVATVAAAAAASAASFAAHVAAAARAATAHAAPDRVDGRRAVVRWDREQRKRVSTPRSVGRGRWLRRTSPSSPASAATGRPRPGTWPRSWPPRPRRRPTDRPGSSGTAAAFG